MKPLTMTIRRWILAAIVLLIMLSFVARLMQIQIVDAEVYRQMLNGRKVSTQTIKAVRGEIVDRNGEPLAANRMGYDVTIDQAFFPGAREQESQNEIILKLIKLFEDIGEKWIDILPVSKSAPFSFESGYDDEIARLRKMINTADYATAEHAMYWLTARYGLENHSTSDARKIAGVRYSMEQRGFSIQTPYTFATDIDISSVIQVKERSYEFLGVDVVESGIRYNPVSDIAPHLIGAIGPIYQEEYKELKNKGYALNDVVGKSGAEIAFEDYLRGTDGKRDIYTDSYGDVIEATESLAPVAGNTVSLTIDSNLQRTGQEALEAQIKYLRETAQEGRGKEAEGGAVVMLDIKTGDILTAATYPTYDLQTYKTDYQSILQEEFYPLVNRAFTGQYAPGSTFKPVVALAGLGSGIIEEHSSVFCGMKYTFYDDYQPNCLDFHGNISVNTALSLSCNIFFYDIGRRAGIDVIDETAKKLGLGEKSGVEIWEYPGQRSNPDTKMTERKEDWFPGDTLQSSIGQLLNSYSPLQLANYAATIANKGTRMELTIINDIREYSTGRIIEEFPPVIADTMDIDPEAFEVVTRGMVAASRTGSARGTFSNYPVDVAAKTGTPETATELPNSTFICFAPADDPQVAIAVVIEKGWHGYTGAPVAKALFDEYFGYTDVRASVPSGPQRLKDERAKAALEAAQSQTPQEEAVPDND